MDYGLLSGLAEGIKSGVQSYQETKRYKDDQDQKAKQAKMGLLTQGYEEDPATGGLKRSALYQQEMQDKLAREAAERAEKHKYTLEEKTLEAKLKAKGPKEVDPLTRELQQGRLAEMRDKQARAEFEKTPKGRLEKLGAQERARVDNARAALSSVREMSNALVGEGQNTISLIGDNDFTRSRSMFEETLGRMQSGGAIGKEEAARFRKMAPGPLDSAETQRKKLMALEKEMTDRLTTAGFSEKDLGEAGFELSQVTPKTKGLLAGKQGGLLKEAQAAAPKKKPVEQMSESEMDQYLAELEKKVGGK